MGLILGIVVGLAMIVGLVKSENSRSKRRSELATIIAAFSKMTVEDSRKIFTPEYYPSWLVFSQRQKLSLFSFFTLSNNHRIDYIKETDILFFFGLQLNWLNVHLTKIWPYVNEVFLLNFLHFDFWVSGWWWEWVNNWCCRQRLSWLRHRWSRCWNNTDPLYCLPSNFPNLLLVLLHLNLQVILLSGFVSFGQCELLIVILG